MLAADNPFDLQGHRGARGLRPENTLAAFAHALSIGVTTLELDTAVTRDGVVVVSHDSELNPDITRDASGEWLRATGPAIFSLTYAEVLKYDVGRTKPGSAYALRFKDQVAKDGERIPRLSDLFALVMKTGNTKVRFNIETKLDPRNPGRDAETGGLRPVGGGGDSQGGHGKACDHPVLRLEHAQSGEADRAGDSRPCVSPRSKGTTTT